LREALQTVVLSGEQSYVSAIIGRTRRRAVLLEMGNWKWEIERCRAFTLVTVFGIKTFWYNVSGLFLK